MERTTLASLLAKARLAVPTSQTAPTTDTFDIGKINLGLDEIAPPIEDVAYAIIENQQTRDTLATVELANIQTTLEIDITQIYCRKTGQPCGTRNDKHLRMMLAMLGKERMSDLFPYILDAHTADHWLYTDSARLDWLQEHDPIGYFVYCASMATEHLQEGYSATKGSWETRTNNPDNNGANGATDRIVTKTVSGFWTNQQAKIKYYHEKVLLWHMLQDIPIAEINEANKTWAVWLAFTKPSYAPTIAKSLLVIGQRGFIAQMATTIRDNIQKSLKAHHITVARFKAEHEIHKSRGSSAFAHQKKFKAKSLADTVAEDWLPAEMLDGSGLLDASKLRETRYAGKLYTAPVAKSSLREVNKPSAMPAFVKAYTGKQIDIPTMPVVIGKPRINLAGFVMPKRNK